MVAEGSAHYAPGGSLAKDQQAKAEKDVEKELGESVAGASS